MGVAVQDQALYIARVGRRRHGGFGMIDSDDGHRPAAVPALPGCDVGCVRARRDKPTPAALCAAGFRSTDAVRVGLIEIAWLVEIVVGDKFSNPVWSVFVIGGSVEPARCWQAR